MIADKAEMRLTNDQLKLAIEALRVVYKNNCDYYPNGFADKVDYEVLVGKLALELASR